MNQIQTTRVDNADAPIDKSLWHFGLRLQRERDLLLQQAAAREQQVAQERAAREQQVAQERAAREEQVAQERAAREEQVAQERAEREQQVARERAEREQQVAQERAEREQRERRLLLRLLIVQGKPLAELQECSLVELRQMLPDED